MAAPLKSNDQIKFAVSTRTYTVRIDNRRVTEYLDRKAQELEMQIIQQNAQKQTAEPAPSDEKVAKELGFDIQNTLFIGNLPPDADEAKLVEHLNSSQKIKELKLLTITSKDKGQKKLGFAIYHTNDDAKKMHVKQLSMPKFNSRQLKFSFADKMKTFALFTETKKSADDKLHKSHLNKQPRPEGAKKNYLTDDGMKKRSASRSRDRAPGKERARRRDKSGEGSQRRSKDRSADSSRGGSKDRNKDQSKSRDKSKSNDKHSDKRGHRSGHSRRGKDEKRSEKEEKPAPVE